MAQTPDSPRQLIVFGVFLTALTVVVLWAAYIARGALLLVYVSALFAIGFSPLVRLLERQKLLPIGSRRLPRWLAILTIYLIILGAITSVGLMVAPPFIRQARSLWAELPDMFARAQHYLVGIGLLDRELTVKEAVQRAPGQGSDAVGAVFGALWGVVGGAFGLVTILILTFYFLIESERMFEAFLRLFPKHRRPQAAEASRQVTLKISAWLTGQLVLAAVIGASAAIGLGLLGVPFFYVLALIAAIGEMIPVVGPILASIPAIAIAFSHSPQLALAVAVFFIAQQQFENHVLVPKVMERQVGVSAGTVIVALLIGGSLLGIVGAILAVPTAAILMVILQELTAPREDA